VVFGATGFVGRLVAEDLAEHAPQDVRIALAGRSRRRLEAVRSGLPGGASQWPVLVADAADEDALTSLAASTRVVATTVGPYLRYGLPLARACAVAGTHYADLTGEILYVRQLIDTCDATARGSGARIVTSCGYDSIPSDLGVHLLHQQAAADASGALLDTTLLARAKGRLSGGTIDSFRAQAEAVQADRAVLRTMVDPYALSPDRAAEPDLGPQREPRAAFVEHETGLWVGPFIMASYNTRVVRRSNSLRAFAYGRRFRYRELSSYGTGWRGRRRATLATAVLGLVLKTMADPRSRPWVDRMARKPGEGPSEERRRAGRFRMDLRTTTESGRRYHCVVAADGDPGYAATAVMFGESALCLALDGERLPPAAGVLTPSTAMGDALVDRLRRREFTLRVEELAAT
jgi:short subunit dehydrogenase-like uncharacterized protein